MGTTSEKLTYLNTTKQKLKDSINALGGDITSETTFRNYATELDNIYSSLPKTTGEGSNLSLTTLKGRINIEAHKGDTKQDTTQGYQLIDRSKGRDSFVYKGVTTTFNQDGSVTMKGTVNEAGNVDGLLMGNWGLSTKLIDLDTSSQYVLKLANNTNNKLVVILINGNNVITTSTGSNPTVFTPTYDGVTLLMVRYVNATLNENIDITMYPMLSKGNNTAYPFEKYTGGQASPNPNYPQDIEVVRGKNLFDINNTITLTQFGITATTNNETGEITLNGTATQNAFIQFGLNTEIESGTILSLSANNPIANSGVRIRLMQDGGTIVGVETVLSNINAKVENIAPNKKANRLQIRVESGTTLTNYIIKPQLEEGTQATSYLPYNTQEVVVSGKNLAKEVKIAEVTTAYNGVMYLDIENDLLPNTVYTLSFIGKNGYKVYLNENITTAQWVTCNGNKQSLTFTTSGNIDKTNSGQYSTNVGGWVIFKNQTGNTETATFTEVMLETGSTTTTYEPYITPTSYQLSLGEYELAKIGTYQDYLYKSNGKWYLHKEIGKVVLDGSETWVYDSEFNYFRCPTFNFGNFIPLEMTSANRDAYYQYSSRFIVNKSWSGAGSFRDSTTTQGIFYPLQNTGYKVLFRNTDYTTTSDFANWLNSNNTNVYYQLATPTDTEITNTTLIEELNEIEKMMSYNGQTNISVSGNLPMILDVSALKGESE